MKSSLLDRHVEKASTAALGPVVTRADIRSSMGPFHVLPEYTTVYPEVVISALRELYREYNRAFTPLVEANREWESDYQYCMADDGSPLNCAVQIDMVGLPQAFLDAVATMTLEEIREILRGRIFEIENSVAVYQLLEGFFSRDGQDSFFKGRFRSALADLKRRFGKPIALLAVTDQKYGAMKASEFGRGVEEALSDTEVEELSGFDRFFGPDEFQKYLASNGGRCDYLLYARTSDPVAKLKKPEMVVEHPLLGNLEMRRIIKANALTFNVDAPDWPTGDYRRINDTKGYMSRMGMAFPIASEWDLFSQEFVKYLLAQGVDYQAVAVGKAAIRCKPAKGTYGCYGHVSGTITDGHFRGELRRNMRRRGRYVVQLEMGTPIITNTRDGMTYTYIDRNFFGIVYGGPQFLGGFRSLMPLDSVEAKKGRNHGNVDTVTAEITCE